MLVDLRMANAVADERQRQAGHRRLVKEFKKTRAPRFHNRFRLPTPRRPAVA